MNRGQSVFALLLGLVPFSYFEHLVDRFDSNHGIRHFSAWNHFLCIAYSQLTRREGLRDLVACRNSQRSKLYHIGFRGKISRSALADANERRDWRLFEALGHRLIAIAVELHRGEDSGLGLQEPLYALDSTTIDLCLTLFVPVPGFPLVWEPKLSDLESMPGSLFFISRKFSPYSPPGIAADLSFRQRRIQAHA